MWELSIFSETEHPLTLTLHTRDAVIPSLLWKTPNGCFYPKKGVLRPGCATQPTLSPCTSS